MLAVGFDSYQEARNYMTEILTISLLRVINWWCQTPPLEKNSADLGYLEKWPKLRWEVKIALGGRPPSLPPWRRLWV